MSFQFQTNDEQCKWAILGSILDRWRDHDIDSLLDLIGHRDDDSSNRIRIGHREDDCNRIGRPIGFNALGTLGLWMGIETSTHGQSKAKAKRCLEM